MHRRHFFALALASTLGSIIAPAIAHEYKVGSIAIKHPWTRATPKGAKVGGGYMTLINQGAQPDRLVAVSSSHAGKVELHEMTEQGGVMKMRPLPDGIALPSGATVTLAPGGLHAMMLDLKNGFAEGESVPARLVFEKAGPVDVTFKVEAMGARGEKSGHSGH